MYLTQRQKVLKALKEAGPMGINSFDARSVALQLPVRIKELKKDFAIKTKTNPDRSVTYILIGENEPEPQFRWEFDDKTNTARKIYI